MKLALIALFCIAGFVSGIACDALPDAHEKGTTRKSIDDGHELIGEPAAEFAQMQWLDGKARTLKELNGSPVLIRFWNRHCNMCKYSAPLLNELYKKYSERGLVVIGIHHKKTAKPDTLDEVKARANEWHMMFPIAMDNDWHTIKRIWMNKDRPMTSATVLIGRDGRIAWIHPGGTLAQTDPMAKQLELAIEQQLALKR